MAGAPLLYERICEHILSEIRQGVLLPGARVSSEMELADQFEVSRITSKKALEVLRQAGVVERIRGKGSFVVRELPDLDQLGIGTPPAAAPAAPADPPARSDTIALVIPDVSETYGLELLCAIEERCVDQGLNLILRRTRGRRDEEERAVEALVGAGRVDGLIVFPVHGEYYNASLLRTVLDGFPLVLVDRYLAGIPVCAVHTDNVTASAALTRHVLDLGHRDVAFVSTPPENTTSIEQRQEGFRLALAERTDPPLAVHQLTDLRSTLPSAFTPAQVRADIERVARFSAAHPEVTAFVVCEYNLARVVAQALPDRRAHLITCFDSPGDPLGGPTFTHVRQDQSEMGRRAVDLLVAQLRGETVPKQTMIPFELVVADPAHTPPAAGH